MRHYALWLGSLRSRPVSPPDDSRAALAVAWASHSAKHRKWLLRRTAELKIGSWYAAPGFVPTARDNWAVLRPGA